VSLGKCNWKKSGYKKNDFAERHGEKQVATRGLIDDYISVFYWIGLVDIYTAKGSNYSLLSSTSHLMCQVNLWLYQHVLS
jgi:hypothetical protein